MIRDVQPKVAESNSRFDYPDALNHGGNRGVIELKLDLPMSEVGCVIMGKRFADKSIQLIEKNQ